MLGLRPAGSQFCLPDMNVLPEMDPQMSIRAAHLVTALLLAPTTYSQEPRPIPLPKAISTFLVAPDTSADWTLGSEEPSIQWITNGVDPALGRNPGGRRKGLARVSVAGKELKHLRQRLEPVLWQVTMSSTFPIKFGVERVELQPQCDTVACEFDLVKGLAGSGVSLTQVCIAGPAPFQQTAYLARKGGKQAVVVYATNRGSGGESNSLEIFPGAGSNQRDWCKEARSAQ